MAVGGPLHGAMVEVDEEPHRLLTVHVHDGDTHEYHLTEVSVLGARLPAYVWNEQDARAFGPTLASAFLRPEVLAG